jgi:hypothetical protein
MISSELNTLIFGIFAIVFAAIDTIESSKYLFRCFKVMMIFKLIPKSAIDYGSLSSSYAIIKQCAYYLEPLSTKKITT